MSLGLPRFHGPFAFKPASRPHNPRGVPRTTDETSNTAGLQDSLGGFPLPGSAASVVAVPAPGEGPGYWAGASSAALDEDGTFVIGYRVRNGHDGAAETVIARSEDGERFTTVATLEQSEFGAKSMERPSLVRTETGRWRLYVCCADPGSPHWWIDAIDADEPEGFAAEGARTIFPGDRLIGVKDPLVQRTGQGWRAWICCHLLDQPGEEDRMNTAYATSEDGLGWEWHGVVLEGRPGAWDARGARVTAVLPDGRASYDGRATAEENGRTHRPRIPERRTRTTATRRERARGRTIPRCLATARRRLSHLLRSQASRREPRTAHGTHPASNRTGFSCVLEYWITARGPLLIQPKT